MIVAIHIIASLASLVCSTAAFVAPTRARIRNAFGLILLTFISGLVLVISTHAPLLHGCVSGLLYAACTSAGALLGWRKLARQVAD